jgi:hypothetical protein
MTRQNHALVQIHCMSYAFGLEHVDHSLEHRYGALLSILGNNRRLRNLKILENGSACQRRKPERPEHHPTSH